MIPFILSELDDWKNGFGKQAVGTLAVCLAVALIFSRFQLLIFLFTVAAWFIWLGWMGANRGWSRRNAWKWIAHEGLAAPAWVAGKLLVYLILAAFHAAIMLPVVVLAAATWGMPAGTVALTLALAFAGGATVVALSLFTGGHEGIGGDLLNVVLVGLWLTGGFVVAGLRAACPFLQIWDLIENLDAGPALAAVAAQFALVAALSALAALFLGKTIRRSA